MKRRFRIAVVVLVIGALVAVGSSAALASGEDAQAEAKKETKAEAAPAADAQAAEAKAKEEAARKELEDAKFNTLEDLFALVARPALTVADTSTGSPKPAAVEPAAPGVEWRRVAESTDEGSD